MRVVVAGCRDYENYGEAKEFIGACLAELQAETPVIFLSGGCRGADKLGERYAEESDIPTERYPADWKRYGRAAGPKRNEAMVNAADLVICFWDGASKGTASLLSYAAKCGKPVKIKYIKGDPTP